MGNADQAWRCYVELTLFAYTFIKLKFTKPKSLKFPSKKSRSVAIISFHDIL